MFQSKFEMWMSVTILLLMKISQPVEANSEDYYYGRNNGYHASRHKYQSRQLDDYQNYGNGELTPGNCIIPDSWKGKWFQSGVDIPIIIDEKSIGDKGVCIESSGDKFHFVVQATGCHRCVVINKRHDNVLEYKESSYCENKDVLENLCSQIQGDAQLISLFRMDATPLDCPFKGVFTFTYNKGNGDCKYPVSHVDTCMEPSRLLLRYQACPEVRKTESTVEELQCLALWKDSTYHYLVGKVDHQLAASNEDRYRCFVYERIRKEHTTVYRIAQSGDATCSGVSSPTEGARTLIFTKTNDAKTKCTFPDWLSSHHWHTLDKKMNVRLHHKNTTIHITDEARRNISSGHYHHGSLHGSSHISSHHYPFFTGGTRIVCHTSKLISEDHVAIVAQHTEGCKSTTVCMHLYKRDSHVIELQIKTHEGGHTEDGECGREDALGPTSRYVTLISTEEKSDRCPYLGKFMATGVTQDGRLVADLCGTSVSPHGAFHSLVVGCGNRATIEFHSRCVSQEPITSYECHGSWEENGTGFLIASPLSRSSTSASRYCFMYAESDVGFRVFSSSDSCHRDGGPSGDGIWAFNLTIDGQCAEPVTGGGSPSTICCDVCWCVTIISAFVLVAVVNNVLNTPFEDDSQSSFLHAKSLLSSSSSFLTILQDSRKDFHSHELRPSILAARDIAIVHN